MFDAVKFPKLRKFAALAPEDCLDKTHLLEYTNYEVTPPLTYRIECDSDDKWDWEILQCGWPVESSPEGKRYESDLDAYHALKHAVTTYA